MHRQADKARVAVMGRGHMVSRNRSVSSSNHLHSIAVNMADGVSPRSHVRGIGSGRGI